MGFLSDNHLNVVVELGYFILNHIPKDIII